MAESATQSSGSTVWGRSGVLAGGRRSGADDDCDGDRPDSLPHEEGAIFTSFKQDLAPYAAEAVGTFLMTLTFLVNYREESHGQGWTGISNTFMIMVLKYAFDHISGANLNPCLTTALVLAGRVSFRRACKMIFAQVLGACCAGWIRFSIGNVTVKIGPTPGHYWTQVAFVEVMYTSLMAFVFLNCVASTRNNPRDDRNGFFGMAVGFVFMAGAFAGARICHVILNSAVAIGISIVDFRAKGVFSLAGPGYLLHDVLGGFLGTWLYRLVRPQEFNPVALQLAGLAPSETRSHQAASRVCAEFVGTFYVVLTKCLNRSATSRNEPWAMMAVIAALVYAVKDVSGAYFNPAVTASVALSRRGVLDVPTAIWDILVQLFAGSLATGLSAGVSRHDIDIRPGHPDKTVVFFVETVFTCLICYTVLTTGTVLPTSSRTKRNNIAGIAYGGGHLVAGYAIKHISGAVLNPVVALAFSTLNAVRQDHESCTSYIVFELVGAVLATCFFFMTHVHLFKGPPTKDVGILDADFRVPSLDAPAGEAAA